MERYLSHQSIIQYPTGKKYKKTTYGGAKVFVKQELPIQDQETATLEFMLHRGKWSLDQAERQKVRLLHVDALFIKQIINHLNQSEVKKPTNLSLDKREYEMLYSSYPDADQLGYYKPSSPEYIRVLDILNNINKRSLIYDAGCNSGGIGKLLIRKRGCRVFGSEICPELAQRAKNKGLTVYCGWAEQTPFPDNYFDHVIMTFILEHVLNPEKLMRETTRLLKKGGVLLGHVPTEFGDWGLKTIGRHPEHLRAFSRRELKNLFKKFKLSSIIIEKRKLVGRQISDYYFFKAIK